MPELPEVETIARTLEPQVQDRQICTLSVRNPGSVEGDLPLESLIGRRIAAVGRRGKLLLWHLHTPAPNADGPPTGQNVPSGLALHLKMSGRVFVYGPKQQPGPHTRVVFGLDDGRQIFFDDARKFGYLRVMTPAVLASWPFWTQLGPEPLELDPHAFARLFAGRRGALKALLLNQTLLAGVGNIYADESLFRAGLRPDRAASTCTEADLGRLHTALCEVLRESIAACGSSIRDYRTAHGHVGAFQNAFAVYGRAGQNCQHCGHPLTATRVAGRATVFCPVCQF